MKTIQNRLQSFRRTSTTILLALAVGLMSAGCQHPDKHQTHPIGKYTLISVDDHEVPAMISHGQSEIRVVSGAFTFYAEGSSKSETVFGPPTGSDINREVRATFSQNGSNLKFKWEGAGETTGTIDDDVFTMNNEGMIFTYKKGALRSSPQ